MAFDEGPFNRIRVDDGVEVYYISKLFITSGDEAALGNDCGDNPGVPDEFRLGWYNENITYYFETEGDFFEPDMLRNEYSDKDENGEFREVKELDDFSLSGSQLVGSYFIRAFNTDELNHFIVFSGNTLWGENVVTSEVKESQTDTDYDGDIYDGYWKKFTPLIKERVLSSQTYREKEHPRTRCEKIKIDENEYYEMDLLSIPIRLEYKEFPESYFIIEGLGPTVGGSFLFTVALKRFDKKTHLRIE